MYTKCTQLHNPPEMKRQVLQAAFQNTTLSAYVYVELIPSLVLGKLSCWKDNLSYKKYNQNLHHLFFSNYIMVLKKKVRKTNFNLKVLASLYSSSPEISTEKIPHGLLDVSGGESSQILAGSDAPLPTADGNLPHAQQFWASKMK